MPKYRKVKLKHLYTTPNPLSRPPPPPPSATKLSIPLPLLLTQALTFTLLPLTRSSGPECVPLPPSPPVRTASSIRHAPVVESYSMDDPAVWERIYAIEQRARAGKPVAGFEAAFWMACWERETTPWMIDKRSRYEDMVDAVRGTDAFNRVKEWVGTISLGLLGRWLEMIWDERWEEEAEKLERMESVWKCLEDLGEEVGGDFVGLVLDPVRTTVSGMMEVWNQGLWDEAVRNGVLFEMLGGADEDEGVCMEGEGCWEEVKEETVVDESIEVVVNEESTLMVAVKEEYLSDDE